MNVRKRGLALLMCICMIFTLLPFSAFADASADKSVVYGTYDDNGTWTKDDNLNDTVLEKTDGDNTLYLTKTAKKTSDNTYEITLKVVSTQTETTTPPGSAATVLVMDVSGSMDICATCNNSEQHSDWDGNYWYEHSENCETGKTGEVQYSETRLKAAKDAAYDFILSYSGAELVGDKVTGLKANANEGLGRYVSVVSFSTNSSVTCEWQDVSTVAGYNAVKAAINGLMANGGTNLDAGLQTANDQFNKEAVKSIKAKNVIALTDGMPTYYVDGNRNRGHGDNGCPDTNDATTKSATELKKSSKVYTVCFGASEDKCWEKGSGHEWVGLIVTKRHKTEGPTVGDFLKDKIATPAAGGKTYAYNADNTAQLMKAFKAITSSITEGIKTGTVLDPMGEHITVTSKPDNFVETPTGYKWELSNPTVATDGGKTTYTYELTYTVTFDPNFGDFDENSYYAANKETTFTAGGEVYNFNVPGVKGTAPKYKVTYEFEGNYPDSVTVPASEQHKAGENVKMPEITAPEGWIFNGWKYDSNTVTSVEMPASDITIIGTFTERKAYTVKYLLNGTDISVKDADTGTKNVGESVEATAPDLPGYTFAGTDADKNQTITVVSDASKNVITFYYYKNVELEANSDTVTYDGEEHSVSGFTGAPEGADFSAIKVGATGTEAGTYPANFADNTVGTVDATGKYIVTKTTNGNLTIDPIGTVTVTITGNNDSKVYNGTEQSVNGYSVNMSVMDESITVTLKEGKAAIAKGTDVGKHMMGLEAEDFVVSSTNNYKEIEVVVVDGYLEITPVTDKVVVTITGNNDTFTYDGKEHTVEGYVVTSISNPLYTEADFSFTGNAEVSRTKVGRSEMGLEAANFQNDSENFKNVKFVINDGGITIKERPYRPNPSITDKITVEITGNSDSVVYDGTEHSVKDYTVKISDSRYTEKDFTFSGKALASGINAGTYEMGLKADQFKNTNARFRNVEFIIKADGVLTITQRPLTITAGSAEGIAPVTCDKYTVEGLATGDKVDSVKITGIQSEPGESPNVASDAVIKNAKGEDVTANYKITYVDGVLKAIEVLNKEIHFNYVIGYTDGTIRPNNDISRAEVATIFFRLLTDEARTQYDKTTSSFSDIKDGAWCCRAVSTLTNMGIIKGYTDGSFQPNKSITRAELATIIARFAKLDVNTKTFSDINGHWAQKNIELAAGNGWINGYEDGTFRPNNNITRAETFAMINRVLDRQTESVSDLLPTSEMNMWSDNLNENAWYYKDVQEATNYHKCDRVGDSVYEKWTEKVPDIDWASYQI